MGLFGIYNSKKIYASVDRVQFTAEEFQRFALQITGPLNKVRQLSLTMVMAPNRELQQQIDGQQQALTGQLDETFANWDLTDVHNHEKDKPFSRSETVGKTTKGSRILPSPKYWTVIAKKHLSIPFKPKMINSIWSIDQVQAWQQAMIRQAGEVNQRSQPNVRPVRFGFRPW